ncbi:uncharacterized protein LOC144034693 [Vanacampus margaritifer]
MSTPKLYSQKYRKDWESVPEFKGWLKPVIGDVRRAYCAYCKSDMLAKVYDIKKHSVTAKHIIRSKPYNSADGVSPLPQLVKKTLDCQSAEAIMAMAFAEHCSLLACEHLAMACKVAFSDSVAATNFQMQRDKCAEIINGVLAPYFLKKIISDVGNEKFSLLLDESSDVRVLKYLGVVIRYFSTKKGTVVSTFLGMIELEACDPKSIAKALIEFLDKCNIKKENLHGIGADNAPVMTAVHQILKEKCASDNLVFIGCICHSLQLAVSAASKENIPTQVEYLIRETYNWFSISKRRDVYKEVYANINCGQKPLQITKVSSTLWLSIEPVVNRILSHWEELKVHFELTKASERCYSADVLHAAYMNKSNYAYLTLLKSVLSDVQVAVNSFEGEQTDPVKLLDNLVHLLTSICTKVVNPTATIDILKDAIEGHLSPSPYLGYLFESTLSQLSLAPDEEKDIRRRCVKFIVALSEELQSRLPDNLEALRNMALFGVEETLLKHREGTAEVIQVAELLGYEPGTIVKIVSQWRNIHLVKWDSTETTIQFWSQVKNYTDSTGANPFQELCNAALAALSLPHSNAEVARLFSRMGVAKSKLRNGMSLRTLNSVLLVRYGLKLAGETCYQHELPTEVLQFGPAATYDVKDALSSSDDSRKTAVQLDNEELEDFLASL